MRLSLFFIIFITLFLTGCSNSKKEINKSVKINEKPKYQIPVKIDPPKAKAKGSLFTGETNSLFSDRKALQLGDIIYITVNEGPTTAETKSTKTTTLNDSGSTTGGSIDNVPSPPLIGGIVEKTASLLNDILGVGFTLPTRSGTFNASAESAIEDSFVYDVSAVVTQHFQNGNYFLEGLKYVVINGQKHTLKITGVMNPDELSGNTIASNKLANLKVVYFKDGDEEEYMEKPWGTKVLETISPF